jgi:hypothetical protein
MDPVQILNGVAAAVAAVIWARAIGPSIRISGVLSGTLAAATFAVCLWYALVNLALGFGLAELGMIRSVPLFRYAFVPLVLLPALRHLSQRHIRRELLAPMPMQEGNTKGGHDT